MNILAHEEYEKTLDEISKICEKCDIKIKVFDPQCKKCTNYQKAMNIKEALNCPKCGSEMEFREKHVAVKVDDLLIPLRETYGKRQIYKYPYHWDNYAWFCPNCNEKIHEF